MLFRFTDYNDKHPEYAVRSSSRAKNSPTRLEIGAPPSKPVAPPKPPKPVVVATTEKAISSKSIEKIVRVVGKEKKEKDKDESAKSKVPKPLGKVTKKMFGPEEKAIWKDDFEKAFKALRFKDESQKSR
jgi:hypothetical protein